MIGPKAEKRLGRKNFMELFAVFTSLVSYTVVTAAGQPLGSLQQEFVDRLVDGVSSFLLGGRGWVVQRIQHDDRCVFVDPAPRGKQTTWGDYIPQFLSLEVCQKMRDILLSSTAFPYLDEKAVAVLEEKRELIQPLFQSGRAGIEVRVGEVRWWTFAGARSTPPAVMAWRPWAATGKSARTTSSSRPKGGALLPSAFRMRSSLSTAEVWDDAKLWKDVAESLPNYRLSKFQDLMPDWVEQKVVGGYLSSVPGARTWCS